MVFWYFPMKFSSWYRVLQFIPAIRPSFILWAFTDILVALKIMAETDFEQHSWFGSIQLELNSAIATTATATQKNTQTKPIEEGRKKDITHRREDRKRNKVDFVVHSGLTDNHHIICGRDVHSKWNWMEAKVVMEHTSLIRALNFSCA